MQGGGVISGFRLEEFGWGGVGFRVSSFGLRVKRFRV